MRFLLMAGLFGLAMSSAVAQSTDVVQRLTFDLKGTVQTSSGAKTVRVGNKEILAALNASGAYNFGPKATLLFIMSEDQPLALTVEEGKPGQTTNTDVSAFFEVTEIGETVSSARGSTAQETWHFGFNNGNTNAETSLLLWGSTTIRHGPIHTPGIGTLAGPQRVQSSVRGVGRLNGATTIFSGTISGTDPSLINDQL